MSTVSLTRVTKEVLQNFSTINSSIVFKKGSTIKTIANAENVLAEYEGEEYWPQDFAIYDLGQFLAAINSMTSRDSSGQFSVPPMLEFLNEDYVNIRNQDGSAVIRYYYSDPEITLKVAPELQVNFPGSNIAFDLPFDMLNALLNCSSNMALGDIKFVSDGNKSHINLCDAENETSNTAKFNPPNIESDGSYDLTLKMDNLLVYKKQVDYRVRVSDQLLSEWVVTNIQGLNEVPKLKYYVALEPIK
jgi:hypothetical protein